jgi:hypothetical protein
MYRGDAVIDALIAGRMYGTASEREDRNGKPFCTCKVRVSLVNGESLFVNVICFEGPAVTALLALADGDSVAISGECTPKVYAPAGALPRPVLDLRAHAVITAYHVARKRQAVKDEVA